jgi:hypothetical protein
VVFFDVLGCTWSWLLILLAVSVCSTICIRVCLYWPYVVLCAVWLFDMSMYYHSVASEVPITAHELPCLILAGWPSRCAEWEWLSGWLHLFRGHGLSQLTFSSIERKTIVLSSSVFPVEWLTTKQQQHTFDAWTNTRKVRLVRSLIFPWARKRRRNLRFRFLQSCFEWLAQERWAGEGEGWKQPCSPVQPDIHENWGWNL